MPDEEAVVRVVAAAVESLLQSRPQMNLDGLLEPWPGPFKFYMGKYRWAEVDGEMKQLWFSYTIRFQRGFGDLELLYSPAELSRGKNRGGVWWHDGQAVSQSEAERLAGSVFTHPHPVQRVSNKAIKKAEELVDAHKPIDD